MENEKLNAKESFAIIQDLIEAEKLRFNENGFVYRFWGWLVILASTCQFILLKTSFAPYHYYPWFLMLFGGLFMGYYYRNEAKKEETKTQMPIAGKVLAFTWILIGINIFLVAFGFYNEVGGFLLMYILSMLSVGTIVAGALLRFKPLVWGAIICNIAGVISLKLDYSYWSIITVCAILASNIIPGYLLKSRYNKSEQNV